MLMKSIGTMITGIIKKYRKYKRWLSLLNEWEAAYHFDLRYLGLYTCLRGFENPNNYGNQLLKLARRADRNLDRLRKLGYYKRWSKVKPENLAGNNKRLGNKS